MIIVRFLLSMLSIQRPGKIIGWAVGRFLPSTEDTLGRLAVEVAATLQIVVGQRFTRSRGLTVHLLPQRV